MAPTTHPPQPEEKGAVNTGLLNCTPTKGHKIYSGCWNLNRSPFISPPLPLREHGTRFIFRNAQFPGFMTCADGERCTQRVLTRFPWTAWSGIARSADWGGGEPADARATRAIHSSSVRINVSQVGPSREVACSSSLEKTGKHGGGVTNALRDWRSGEGQNVVKICNTEADGWKHTY